MVLLGDNMWIPMLMEDGNETPVKLDIYEQYDVWVVTSDLGGAIFVYFNEEDARHAMKKLLEDEHYSVRKTRLQPLYRLLVRENPDVFSNRKKRKLLQADEG